MSDEYGKEYENEYKFGGDKFSAYKNKKVIVCGMGRSGLSSARLLRRLGAEVTLQDLKAPEKAKTADLNEMESLGIELCMGANPDDIIENYDLVVMSPGISAFLPFAERARELDIPVIGEIELAYSL